MTAIKPIFPGVLLAGGQSRRMGGGSKFLQEIDGKSLLCHIISTIEPQVTDLILNININPEAIGNINIPMVTDSVGGFVGPLSGILTGLEYFIENNVSASHMLSVPTDAPFIPKDLVARLQTGLSDHPERTIVMAESVGRVHPVVALWPLALAADLRSALVEEDLRKILVFADRYTRVNVVWGDHEGDPFFNINRPEDLDEARKRLA